MLPDFNAQPGFFFVAATLLPLLSFVLIFLGCGLWALFRTYRNSGAGEWLYNLFGGDRGGRGAAYVALAGIAAAFLCSLVGAVTFLREAHDLEQREHHLKGEIAELRPAARGNEEKTNELEAKEAELTALQKHWADRWTWIRLSPAGLNDADRGTTLQVGFRIDHLSALMFVMVTFVASLIHLFSIGYMGDELGENVVDHQVHAETEDGHYHRRGRFGRFFMYLSLFSFSMLNLVLADNLFQVFVSWELVGICSYLLVGFYFERQSASDAANKAFITNRVGDAGFIIGLLILWTYVGSFNFEDIFARVRSPLEGVRTAKAAGGKERPEEFKLALGGKIVRANPAGASETAGGQTLMVAGADASGTQAILFPRVLDDKFTGVEPGETIVAHASPTPTQYGSIPYWLLVVAGLGIFLGCVGKSAQFPLHVWLPDAMEGPTPVSALIHAATMVAAGVYLVGRSFPLFTPEVLLVIAYVGGITAFVAATVAVVMTDIKKVLAYSTVSQLGYMMLALGVGGWVAGLFHLLTHAFFKALLFLGSGSVIYGCHHEQEMTKMGGLRAKMPITALTMLLGVLAIAGVPFFSGWYSKDAILASSFGYFWLHPEHALLFLLPLVTAGLTSFYMFRMWFMTFAGRPRDHHVYDHARESPPTMTVPLILLAACSLAVAWGWPVWDPQQSWLEHQIHHAQPTSVIADFGIVLAEEEVWDGAPVKPLERNERYHGHIFHEQVGLLVLGLAVIGFVFAALIYWKRVLDTQESKEQFPATYRFLRHKWYFDEIYSVLFVRPALVVAHWCRAFDTAVIDGLIHGLAYGTVRLSDTSGAVDRNAVDGLVNLVGNVTYGVGGWLRNVQTGSLRNYVLFLVLASAGVFALLTYFVALAFAG